MTSFKKSVLFLIFTSQCIAPILAEVELLESPDASESTEEVSRGAQCLGLLQRAFNPITEDVSSSTKINQFECQFFAFFSWLQRSKLNLKPDHKASIPKIKSSTLLTKRILQLWWLKSCTTTSKLTWSTPELVSLERNYRRWDKSPQILRLGFKRQTKNWKIMITKSAKCHQILKNWWGTKETVCFSALTTIIRNVQF